LIHFYKRNSKMAGDEVGTGGSAEGNEGAVDTTREVNQGPGVPNDKTNEQMQDDLIMKQQESIAAQIAENNKLVTSLEDFSHLIESFSNDPLYSAKLALIANTYSNVRRTRPDGNCFFRSWGFRLFEYLLNDEKRLEEFKLTVKPSKDEMIELGMPAFTVEDFYDNFMDNLDRLSGDDKMSVKELEDLFNDEGTSNYLVVFLRLLVSKQLQQQSEFYQNFIEDNIPLKDFCGTEVEPMFKESDHIHIIGLTAATGVGVRVIYLDRGGEKVQEHDFPEGMQPMLHLIYRPGHYDILYPK